MLQYVSTKQCVLAVIMQPFIIDEERESDTHGQVADICHSLKYEFCKKSEKNSPIVALVV